MAVSNGEAVLCRDVCFSYVTGTQVLKNINLTVGESETVGLIGPNGAGKSTFLSLLNGVRRAEGEIHISGNPVIPANSALVKSLIGLVFQNPNDQLFCPTIFEDVAFGPLNMRLPKNEVIARVQQALKEVGLEGYEKRSSLHLSFGEQKLAAIATILSMQPGIIAMDEPTSNLDHLHRRKIITWLQNNKRTCLVTSHDLDMIYQTCSRVILLNGGRMVADGPVNEILTDRDLLEQNDLELPLGLQGTYS